MLKLLAAGLLVYISKATQVIECTPGESCVVDGNSTLIVIAPCGVTDLVVNCDDGNQCKKNGVDEGLFVYTSANNSDINCIGPDSCEEITLVFGSGPASSADNFNCARSSVEVVCAGKQSCKAITIDNTGVVSNGLNIITPTDTSTNTGAFLYGFAECGFDTQCSINCGDHIDTCKDASCYDNCECIGSACPDKINERPTSKPTTPPVEAGPVEDPTPKPTPAPIPPRNETTCDVNGCILEPGNHFDVFCPSNIRTCNVDCTGEAQCQNGVIIYANSAVVVLTCDSKNSCDKVALINTDASDITVELTGEKAAEKMDITISNELSNLTLTASGKESFSMGKLVCNGKCDVDCSGESSCKVAKYECLSPSTQCELICDSDNNQCPTIANFGDADCSSGSCTVNGDGSSRIIALSGADTLTVVCDNTNAQCKKNGAGLDIYTGAGTTILKCSSVDACEGVSLYAGPLSGDKLPRGFNENEFVRASYNVIVEANDKCAAKSLDLCVSGNTQVTINGDGADALQDATLICNGCAGLTVNCREFDGCLGTNILCTDPLSCECINAYEVDIGNDTDVLATTQTPRDSCPLVSQFVPRSGSIANVNHNGIFNKTGMTFSMGALVPITIIGGIIIVAGLLLIKKNKKYRSLSGQDTKTMLKNENIYSTYQVEMHQ